MKLENDIKSKYQLWTRLALTLPFTGKEGDLKMFVEEAFDEVSGYVKSCLVNPIRSLSNVSKSSGKQRSIRVVTD